MRPGHEEEGANKWNLLDIQGGKTSAVQFTTEANRVNDHLTLSLKIPLKNLGFGEVGN